MSIEISSRLRGAGAIALLALFLIVVLGMGIFIGTQSAPGAWYANLNKPFFNPPNWIFGPVWTVLYVFIAVAGWRTFRAAPRSKAMVFWYGQMALNWAWSPLFFVLHQVWIAFAVIAGMFVLILLFIKDRWHPDPASALLFCAYAAWVGFAGLLNLSLALLN
ncbi:TspO/MBR family protein [Roseibium sp. HPY-6]|uniref:TspO/MBR family protein n=1 Tax=Roseibium sp. HPY-6 TaxID=3229852 RepID=UPI00338D7068